MGLVKSELNSLKETTNTEILSFGKFYDETS